jgi:hypothetical protein
MSAAKRLAIVIAVLATPALLIPILLRARADDPKPKNDQAPRIGPASEEALTPEETSVESPTPVRTPVDLLKLVDPSRDAVAGTWAIENGALLTPEVPWGRLEIPCLPPDEYELRVVATRVRGGDSLNLGLATKGRQFMVVLDGNGGTQSGLDLIKGKGFGENSTTFSEKVFPPGVPTAVLARVRKTGLTVSVGSRKVLEWAGDLRSTDVLSSWYVRSNGTLFVGAYATQFRIDEMRLTPLTGELRMLR